MLQKSLDEFSDMTQRDVEMSARVRGIAAMMTTFNFLFGIMLGKKLQLII